MRELLNSRLRWACNLLTAQSPKPVPVKLIIKRAADYGLIVRTESGLISVQRDDFKFNIPVAKFWLILFAVGSSFSHAARCRACRWRGDFSTNRRNSRRRRVLRAVRICKCSENCGWRGRAIGYPRYCHLRCGGSDYPSRLVMNTSMI